MYFFKQIQLQDIGEGMLRRGKCFLLTKTNPKLLTLFENGISKDSARFCDLHFYKI